MSNLLQRIEKVRTKGTIVSSNTSGIPLQAMSDGLSDEFRQHFLGTHFFNPVRYMKLLEIISGRETLPEVLEFMADYGERILGKGLVWAKDTPNFVANRIGVQGMVKAIQLMVDAGMTIPQVDALFGPVLGRPKTAKFKTADLVGLDVLAHVAIAVKEERFDDLEKMIAGLQYGLLNLHDAPFPVVAAPFGLAPGGGCELCLAADKITAHAELYMGQVEIGVGLVPSGGGCLNLWRKFLESVPAVVTDMDLAKFFIPVFMSIAMAKVSMSAAEARANGFLGPRGRIVLNRDHLIGEAKKDVLKMVDEGYAPPVKRRIKVLGQAAQGMVAAQIADMASGGFVSEYDAFLAGKIAYIISGGDVRDNAEITDDVILTLERESFIELLKQEKTQARIEHMLKTGKPLRN